MTLLRSTYLKVPVMCYYTELPGTCGDQNDDGIVDILDVVIDMQITVGAVQPTDIQLILGDLNRDDTVNVLDAIMSLQHIVGLISSLEVCVQQ